MVNRLLQYERFMAIKYQDKFPAAFSEQGRDKHLYLEATDFEIISNSAISPEFNADEKSIDQVVNDLQAIRSAQKSTSGEIRIYARSLRTGEALFKSVHPNIRKENFVEVIGISNAKQNWKKFSWPHVTISDNGVMTADDRELLHSDIDQKVFVIMSGGEGRSDMPFYQPLAQFIRKLIDEEVYLWAVCMSYQVLADQVLCLGIKRGQDLPPPQTGRLRVGTQIAKLTDNGKSDQVFSIVAPAFAVESWNHFRIYGDQLESDEPQKNVKILARDYITNDVIAIKVGETCWAIQYHPELKKIARKGKGIQNKKSISVQNKFVILPKGTHSYQEVLISTIAKNKKAFLDKYNIVADDLQQFFHPARQIHNVGDKLLLAILEQAVAAKKRQLGLR